MSHYLFESFPFLGKPLLIHLIAFLTPQVLLFLVLEITMTWVPDSNGDLACNQVLILLVFFRVRDNFGVNRDIVPSLC